jgi:hypothetical protein
MNNIHCICTTPDVFPVYVNNWNNFPKDSKELIWLSDITRDPSFEVGFKFTEQDIRKEFNFNIEVSKQNFWNSYGNRNIVWFFAHLRMLYFYVKNPNYDYYWFFDDDIKMENWDEFFINTDKDDSDFLSYFCFKKNGVTSQDNVPTIDDRTFSKNGWFDRFPGDGDILPEQTNDMFGSFFPTTRFSNRALSKLLEIHKNGYYGYHEGFVPTVLNNYGFKLSSLINSDNTSNYFNVNEVNILHKNIKVNWEWI